jgi:hypothetical protein
MSRMFATVAGEGGCRERTAPRRSGPAATAVSDEADSAQVARILRDGAGGQVRDGPSSSIPASWRASVKRSARTAEPSAGSPGFSKTCSSGSRECWRRCSGSARWAVLDRVNHSSCRARSADRFILRVRARRISSVVPTTLGPNNWSYGSVVDQRRGVEDEVDVLGQPLPSVQVQAEPFLADVADEHLQMTRRQFAVAAQQVRAATDESVLQAAPGVLSRRTDPRRTITMAMLLDLPGRPNGQLLRRALRHWAFVAPGPGQREMPAEDRLVLQWVAKASRPLVDLHDPALCAGADSAEVAQRAGNSVEVLLSRYAKCLYDRQSINNQRIDDLLRAYDQPPELDQ